jgi:hypothetical protein
MRLIEVKQYIDQIQEDEARNQSTSSENTKSSDSNFGKLYFMYCLFLSICDFTILLFILNFKKKKITNKKIIFTHKGFCFIDAKNNYQDRLLPEAVKQNAFYIIYGKEYHINKIEGKKVYNIGVLAKVVSFFYFKQASQNLRYYCAFNFLNNMILKKLNGNEVFTLCHYDMNGLSLVYSNYRKNFTLIEFQHGSMINYHPYSYLTKFKMIDVFYVRNQKTIEYLKNNFCKNKEVVYKTIQYPKTNLLYKKGINILYASTVETNGLHQNFISFLKNTTFDTISIIIRLHPREKDKKAIFENQLKQYTCNFVFDQSKNWLEGNSIQNLIVVSPSSSVIEEALDNGFKVIIIDQVGEKRYSGLIDNKNCIFSDSIENTILENKWY